MDNEIKIGKKIFIRTVGKDEYWLQDIIYDDPKVLGLGNLIAINRERKQSSGGRLDILLKEPEENTMYEVEVMLGETDPSHIIRAIEYWDNEKRKYPQRQHFCVLVAESFERRYFNVIQLMSLSIPMIAIQVDLLEIGHERILNFTKIINIYVEPEEDEDDVKVVNEFIWNNDSSWTNENAKKFVNSIQEEFGKPVIKYTQSYISININGRTGYWLNKRVKPNSALFFNEKDDEKSEIIKSEIELKGVDYSYSNRYKQFMIIVNNDFFEDHGDLLNKIHEIKYRKVNVDE